MKSVERPVGSFVEVAEPAIVAYLAGMCIHFFSWIYDQSLWRT
jgi:hypothetical protein